jgi:hypothetical protein
VHGAGHRLPALGIGKNKIKKHVRKKFLQKESVKFLKKDATKIKEKVL